MNTYRNTTHIPRAHQRARASTHGLHSLAACAGVLLWLTGCGGQSLSASQDNGVPVAVAQHVRVEGQVPAAAFFWSPTSQSTESLLVGAIREVGLMVYAGDGTRVGEPTEGDFDFAAQAPGFDAGRGAGGLLVAHDRNAAGLRAFVFDAGSRSLREISAAALPVEDEATGLCVYRSGDSGRFYAFVATGSGDLQQWELFMQDGALRGRIVRRVAVGAGAGYCVADDEGGVVYVADEAVGIWRIAAEPEADPARTLVDLVGPRGGLGEEVKGLALHRTQAGRFLLAADEDAAVVHVYEIPADVKRGSFRLQDMPAAKFESVWAGATNTGNALEGRVVVADERGDGAAFRVLRWDALAAALKLPASAPVDPRLPAVVRANIVEPTVETEPVLDFGDAADDPAIWVHPDDPSRSLVIGAQKRRGLEVYDLEGRRIQVLADGRINNVDVRQGVLLGERRRDIVAGSNRTTRGISLYEVDPRTRQLTPVAATPIPTGFDDPYGLCMYHSARTGRLHVFVNDAGSGIFRQWEITATRSGLTAQQVREFAVGSQAEGCAADDETGALYVAEEDVGLWRYAAEPDAGNDRRRIDATGAEGRLKADVEGVAIHRGPDGRGYLVVSNQGADNYAVYRREGDNAFVGFFSIAANDELGIDGASETDGLEVTSASLGRSFPQGLLVVQDGRNITPAERQNFKLVPWERVVAALDLE